LLLACVDIAEERMFSFVEKSFSFSTLRDYHQLVANVLAATGKQNKINQEDTSPAQREHLMILIPWRLD